MNTFQTSTPVDPRLKSIAKISKLMDSQFEIGGFKFGLDPILNLIPFAGDAASGVVSFALVYSMHKHGASGKIVVKMLLNVLVDLLVGAIPLLGWVFDFYFKANDRNIKLLNEHYLEGKHTGSGNGIFTWILVGFVVFIALTIWVMWTVTSWLVGIVF
jgi:phosphoglycerol transferase MdoB-like AlkP superfamily enzyme